jgi:hypothetical protein
MSVTVDFLLFLKPCDELAKIERIKPADIRRLGRDLHARLEAVADAAEKLRQDGWSVHLQGYGLTCSNDDLNTEQDAARRLRELGISKKLGSIDEHDNEDAEDGDNDVCCADDN